MLAFRVVADKVPLNQHSLWKPPLVAGSLGFGGHREHLVLDNYHRLVQTVFMDQKVEAIKQAAVVALAPAAAAALIDAVLPPK